MKFYHDLTSEDAENFVSKLRNHSIATFREKARSAAWRKIPSAYLICDDDQIFPVQGQEAMVDIVRQGGGEIVVEHVNASHSAHLSQPSAVVNFLRRAAGEKIA